MSKIKYSIKNVHYAPEIFSDVYDTTPVAEPGAKSISLESFGEIFEFWADGVLYYQSNGTSGYSGSLVLAKISDKFRQDILGETLDSKNVLVEKSSTSSKRFALGFDIETDSGDIRFWFYGCTASRPGVTANSKEKTLSADTDTLTITVAGLSNGTLRTKTTDETDSEVKSNWFKSVYMEQPATEMSSSGQSEGDK